MIADPDKVMLWAAAVLCFFGFFRAGEICLPTLTAFKQEKHLSWGDVSVDSITSPNILRVKLKKSKTDQLGHGADVFVGKTECPICPVAGVLAYMVTRGNQAGPFFRFQDRKPLTKPAFTKEIRTVLETIGLPYQNFAGHSFRIGAATAAAKAGLEDSTIRTLGRWNSSAFLTYIRMPRDHLAKFSALLSQK